MILTTTGTVASVTITGLRANDDTYVVLTHPQTLNLLEFYDSEDLRQVSAAIQGLIDAGSITAVNVNGTSIDDVEQTTSDVTDLAPVAFTGNYTDLQGAPTIPGAAPVDSVNGQTGVVVLDKTDVGLSNVENTSDAAKPISTATQTALNTTNSNVGSLQTSQSTQDAAIALNTAKVSATGNELEASDIDTLAKVNTIVTDATLIDTNDPRLSDSRTPTAHTHTESDITDLDKYTRAEVDSLISSAINALINGAPGALDALNELAAAMGNDPNFATTVNNAIAAVQNNLNQEITNRTTADATLQSNIDAETSARISADDALQIIVDELGLNQTDLITLTGVAENSSNLGTFTGAIISASRNIKQALQDLATFIRSHVDNTLNPHLVTFTQAVTADPGTDITVAEAEELTNTSVTELHKHRRLTDPAGATQVNVETNGSVTLTNYDSSRDDGKTTHNRNLYVDNTGQVQVGEVRSSYIPNSGRVYGYSDARWIAIHDDLYGSNYYQYTESAGTGTDPIIEWEHNGTLIPAGGILKSFHLAGRVNNTQFSDLEISIVYVLPNPLSRYATGFDADAEVTSTEIYRGNFSDMVLNFTGQALSGAMNDKHYGVADINFQFPTNGELRLYVKPVGNLTSTRYFYGTWTWEIL